MLTLSVKYIVYKKNGEPLENAEATQLLQPYGDISKVEDLPAVVKRNLNIPPTSKVVSYAMYDAKRDVVKVCVPDVLCTTNLRYHVGHRPSFGIHGHGV